MNYFDSYKLGKTFYSNGFSEIDVMEYIEEMGRSINSKFAQRIRKGYFDQSQLG